MKNLGKIIIGLIVLIIILIVAIIFNIFMNRQKEKEIISNEGDAHIFEGNREIIRIDSFQVYFQLDNCVRTFIDFINNNKVEAIKSVLIDNYSEQKYINDNLNLENYSSFLNTKYTIEEIHSLSATYEKPYFIKGLSINNSEIEYKFFVIFLDIENNTFSIKDITEEEYRNIINGNVDFKENNIKENNYNKINVTYFSEEDIAKKYFYDYIENIVYAPTYAYKTLDKEYEQRRFGNYNEYKDYLRLNIEKYKLMEKNRAKTSDSFENEEEYSEYLKKKFYAGFYKYKVNKYDNYTQYICMDFDNNYYIFEVKSDFSYDVILDTYTIDLPQFTEKYNSVGIKEKVAMNIDKFIKSINDNNYKYAYNCLAESFKNNKFKNIEVFEKFMKQKVFEKNTVEYKDFKNEGETYICNIILKNFYNDAETKNMEIIMKLGEGTDFVMSFNIK